MQSIAAENNLPETAFIVRDGNDYRLRRCTPVVEVPFGGHATVASAAVVMNNLEPDRDEVIFHTKNGALIVSRKGSADSMDFPAMTSSVVTSHPAKAFPKTRPLAARTVR